MIINLGEKIAHKLAASGTISSEDIDLYGYGFFLLLSSALYLVVVAIFGSAFGILWESIVFYFLFSILRVSMRRRNMAVCSALSWHCCCPSLKSGK